MRLAIQGKPVEVWPPEVWARWHEVTDRLPRDDGYYIAANYFEPRPYISEWDRGNERGGFCYTVSPGRRVCLYQFSKEEQASKSPWYWTSGSDDHDACGLVLGLGRSGNIHYVKAGIDRPMTACNSGAANFEELEFHGELVTCGNCCSIAKHNRHKIKMREGASRIVYDQSRHAYRTRENQRLKEGNAWRGRHRVKTQTQLEKESDDE